MLKTLKDLFNTLLPPQAGGAAAPTEHALELATAVLLVEVMRASPEIGAAERQAVLSALRDKFALSADESDRLLELADRTAREATDFFGFTSRLNEAFGMEQKLRMIEHMWRVAYADGGLDQYEDHLVRKISHLLYVPHVQCMLARQRARGAA
jgi:uncharacterized tellurite resistance protein B-like protein